MWWEVIWICVDFVKALFESWFTVPVLIVLGVIAGITGVMVVAFFALKKKKPRSELGRLHLQSIYNAANSRWLPAAAGTQGQNQGSGDN